MIIGIVAIAQNYAIGRGGKLPWHFPADLKFFKRTTTGNAVVMGFNTWKAIGKPLPNRLNIVLSRSEKIEHQPNLLLVRSREETLALTKYLNCNLFIIGGAKTYENFADAIEKWIVSEVPLSVDDADTFMPENFLNGFEPATATDIGDGLTVREFHRKSF